MVLVAHRAWGGEKRGIWRPMDELQPHHFYPSRSALARALDGKKEGSINNLLKTFIYPEWNAELPNTQWTPMNCKIQGFGFGPSYQIQKFRKSQTWRAMGSSSVTFDWKRLTWVYYLFVLEVFRLKWFDISHLLILHHYNYILCFKAC